MSRLAHIDRPARSVPWCGTCRLRQNCGPEDFSQSDLAFMSTFKLAHEHAWSGDVLLREDQTQPRLLTLYSGWAVRCRTLPSGERQILGVLLSGDLIGLESVISNAQGCSVEAVTDVTFCVLDSARIDELLGGRTLGRRLLSVLLLDIQQVSDRLAVIGSCDALRNLAHFICDLYDRLHSRHMVQGLTFRLPLSTRQLAEALGLTTVHLHRTLRTLRKQDLLILQGGSVEIRDLTRLRALSPLPSSVGRGRPFV